MLEKVDQLDKVQGEKGMDGLLRWKAESRGGGWRAEVTVGTLF